MCLSTVEKRTAILHLTISSPSNGTIFIHRPFRLCMKSIRSVAIDLDRQVLSVQNLQRDLQNDGQQLSDLKADYQIQAAALLHRYDSG